MCCASPEFPSEAHTAAGSHLRTHHAPTRSESLSRYILSHARISPVLLLFRPACDKMIRSHDASGGPPFIQGAPRIDRRLSLRSSETGITNDIESNRFVILFDTCSITCKARRFKLDYRDGLGARIRTRARYIREETGLIHSAVLPRKERRWSMDEGTQLMAGTKPRIHLGIPTIR